MNSVLSKRAVGLATSPSDEEEKAYEMEDQVYHRSVLVTEVVNLLAPAAGAFVVDGTCGGLNERFKPEQI